MTGLTVAEVTDLRRKMRAAGATFKVAKNRLANLALDGTRFDGIKPLLKGPTALAWSKDPVAVAKAAVEFAKTNEKFVLSAVRWAPRRLMRPGSRRWPNCRRWIRCVQAAGDDSDPGHADRRRVCRRRPAQLARVFGAYAREGRGGADSCFGMPEPFTACACRDNFGLHGTDQSLDYRNSDNGRSIQKLVDELSSLTVLEAAELSKLLEEKWGVSAAAPVAAAAAAGRGCRCGRPGRGADRVHRHPGQGRRQEDQRHQGSPHDHRPRPEGSQGSGRSRAEAGEGRRGQGRGREDQEGARGGRGRCRDQVIRPIRTIRPGWVLSDETGWRSGRSPPFMWLRGRQ